MKVIFCEEVEDKLLKFAVIVSRAEGKWVFCKHRNRKTLELPGGHREDCESIDETACRELCEETGAIDYSIRPVCIYAVLKTAVEDEVDDLSYGKLYFAEINSFEKELHSEIERIVLLDDLPQECTYPQIQPRLVEEVIRRKIV